MISFIILQHHYMQLTEEEVHVQG